MVSWLAIGSTAVTAATSIWSYLVGQQEEKEQIGLRLGELDALVGLGGATADWQRSEEERMRGAAETMYGEGGILDKQLGEITGQIGDIETLLGIQMEGYEAQRGYLEESSASAITALGERKDYLATAAGEQIGEIGRQMGFQVQGLSEAQAGTTGDVRAGAAASGVSGGSVMTRAARVASVYGREKANVRASGRYQQESIRGATEYQTGALTRQQGDIRAQTAYGLGEIGRAEDTAESRAAASIRGLETSYDIMETQGGLSYESALGAADRMGLSAEGTDITTAGLLAEQAYYESIGFSEDVPGLGPLANWFMGRGWIDTRESQVTPHASTSGALAPPPGTFYPASGY